MLSRALANDVMRAMLTSISCGRETGFDINAGPVWLEYIAFLKAAPVSFL